MLFPCGAGVHLQNYPKQKVEMDHAHPTQSADQHYPSSLGLEPPEEAEKKKTSSDEEKNSAGKNAYLSLLVCSPDGCKRTAVDIF